MVAGQISESLFFLSLYFLLLVFLSSPPLVSTLCHLPSLPHVTLLNLPLHPPSLPFHPLLLLASVALILFCCPKFSSPSDPLLFLVSGLLVLLFSIVTLLIFVTKEVEKNCCKKKIHIIYALSFLSSYTPLLSALMPQLHLSLFSSPTFPPLIFLHTSSLH